MSMPWPMTLEWYSNTWRRSPSTRSRTSSRVALCSASDLACHQVRRHVGAQRLQLGPDVRQRRFCRHLALDVRDFGADAAKQRQNEVFGFVGHRVTIRNKRNQGKRRLRVCGANRPRPSVGSLKVGSIRRDRRKVEVFLHPANARLEFADLTHRASRMSQTRGGLPADYLSLAPDRAVSLATPAAVRHYHKKCLKYWILPTQ